MSGYYLLLLEFISLRSLEKSLTHRIPRPGLTVGQASMLVLVLTDVRDFSAVLSFKIQ